MAVAVRRSSNSALSWTNARRAFCGSSERALAIERSAAGESFSSTWKPARRNHVMALSGWRSIASVKSSPAFAGWPLRWAIDAAAKSGCTANGLSREAVSAFSRRLAQVLGTGAGRLGERVARHVLGQRRQQRRDGEQADECGAGREQRHAGERVARRGPRARVAVRPRRRGRAGAQHAEEDHQRQAHRRDVPVPVDPHVQPPRRATGEQGGAIGTLARRRARERRAGGGQAEQGQPAEAEACADQPRLGEELERHGVRLAYVDHVLAVDAVDQREGPGAVADEGTVPPGPGRLLPPDPAVAGVGLEDRAQDRSACRPWPR